LPVATVLPFETIDEAVAIANDSIYGLSAGVWTSDVTTAHKVARDLEAGVVWVNCYDLGDMTQPRGGFKQSGIGRDKCLDTLNAVSESKSVWINLD
jgi:acyl-CoA reductase-like NAD-dependent aldehyde dehydrogenase